MALEINEESLDFMIRTPKRHQKIFRAGKDDLISPFKSNSGCWEDRDGGNLYQDYGNVYQENSGRKAGREIICSMFGEQDCCKEKFAKRNKGWLKIQFILENFCLVLKAILAHSPSNLFKEMFWLIQILFWLIPKPNPPTEVFQKPFKDWRNV